MNHKSKNIPEPPSHQGESQSTETKVITNTKKHRKNKETTNNDLHRDGPKETSITCDQSNEEVSCQQNRCSSSQSSQMSSDSYKDHKDGIWSKTKNMFCSGFSKIKNFFSRTKN